MKTALGIALSLMMLSWPVAAYIASAKIRKFPSRVTFRYVLTACLLTAWLGIMFTDWAAMKVMEMPWIEFALPVCWLLAGVLFVVFHLIRNRLTSTGSGSPNNGEA